MEYHFDREIRLSEDSPHKSLYAWYLQEFSKDGAPLGNHQTFWLWSLYFTASEVSYHLGVEIGDDKANDEASREWIFAKLRPGAVGRDSRHNVRYSMFGTERTVENFSLNIRKCSDAEPTERCTLWGTVSSTFDIDFRDVTEPDQVIVEVSVSPARFDHLRQMIGDGRVDELGIRVGRAMGLYAEWSPAVTTNRVKILTEEGLEALVRPEGATAQPRVLGEVGEFRLNISTRNALTGNLKADEVDSEPVDEIDSESSETDEQSKPDPLAEILGQLSRVRAAIGKQTLPLWIAVGLLVLILIFR